MQEYMHSSSSHCINRGELMVSVKKPAQTNNDERSIGCTIRGLDHVPIIEHVKAESAYHAGHLPSHIQLYQILL